LVSVELVFHIINYNYLSSKGIKKTQQNKLQFLAQAQTQRGALFAYSSCLFVADFAELKSAIRKSTRRKAQ